MGRNNICNKPIAAHLLVVLASTELFVKGVWYSLPPALTVDGPIVFDIVEVSVNKDNFTSLGGSTQNLLRGCWEPYAAVSPIGWFKGGVPNYGICG